MLLGLALRTDEGGDVNVQFTVIGITGPLLYPWPTTPVDNAANVKIEDAPRIVP